MSMTEKQTIGTAETGSAPRPSTEATNSPGANVTAASLSATTPPDAKVPVASPPATKQPEAKEGLDGNQANTTSADATSRPLNGAAHAGANRLAWFPLRFLAPVVILLSAAAILFFTTSSWNAWGSAEQSQTTDDAYLRADITPLSTKVSGTVTQVAVEDYQRVKAGELLVQLKNNDYRAQAGQAEAGVRGAQATLELNTRQKALQDARIEQAKTGVDAARAEIEQALSGVQAARADRNNAQSGVDAANAAMASAEAGIEGAKAEVQSAQAGVEGAKAEIQVAQANVEGSRAEVQSAQAGVEAARAEVEAAQTDIEGAQADVDRTRLERTRQEALVASGSATRQRLEQVVAEADRFKAALAGRQAELLRGKAALASREAALAQAQTAQTGRQAALQQVQTLLASRQAALLQAKTVVTGRYAALRQAEAQRASRLSEVAKARAQFDLRQAALAQTRAQLAGRSADLDAQFRQRLVLDAQRGELSADLNARQEALKAAQTTLEYTRILAPADGVVSERKVRVGQLVSPGTQALSLIENTLWIQANYKETQLAHARKGDAAEATVDGLPGVVLKGHVEEIAPASGSQFALLPPDNTTGNYTKIAQRIPVKIALDLDPALMDRLRPGMSVVVKIKTSGTAERGQR